MPHFKCTACKARLHSPVAHDDPVGHLCPSCGSQLEPVANLSEIVGFSAIKPVEERLDAERWLVDGSGFPEAVAKALAPPTKDDS